MVGCWEIIRYRCQVKLPNNRWTTIKECFQEEDAERWLMAEWKYGDKTCRVIREEVMRLDTERMDE